MNKAGIYEIINLITGDHYIGSAKNFIKRFRIHLRQLRLGIHHSTYLQRAWNKYSEDAFEIIILEIVEDLSLLIQREQYWIDNIRSTYNICKIANSSLGVKRSEETNEKCRSSHIGEVHTLERRITKSKSQGGKNHWQYGKKMPLEVIQKKSESMKLYYKTHKNPNSKAILKYDLDGNLLAEYNSIAEASKYNKGLATMIGRQLMGKTKRKPKFIWKYKTNMLKD